MFGFRSPVTFGPGWHSHPGNDDVGVSAALFFLACFGGPAAPFAFFGGLAGVACFEGVRALHRQYQILMRKGYYGCERRREDAHRKFVEEIASLSQSDEPWQKRYKEIFAEYLSELRRIDDDFARETGRSVRRRCERRLAAWGKWAQTFAEAVRRGQPPPPTPSGRQGGGNGGVPIRRLCERSSSPPPSPDELLAQFEKAKGRGPVEEKIRLGSMMLDIEATVDSSLVRDPSGEIVGRNAGIRGWIVEYCPALLAHYHSLMGYRRLADEFRKAHGLRDPHPATRLLEPEFPAEAFVPAIRKAMRIRYVAARRMLASADARTVRGLAESLARKRRSGAATIRQRNASDRRRTRAPRRTG